MCGFIGYISQNSNTKYNLTNAANEIKHRGPDMQNIIIKNNWSVAFNRLSILDLSKKAMQPFIFENITVFVNGEIYNYLEIKKELLNFYNFKTSNDCEVIPVLYKIYGIKFLDKLNGFFSIVIIDENKKKFYFIRDRYGKKPLYYHLENNNFFFTSEIKALKKLKDLKPDKMSINANLSSWFLSANQSLYTGVKNVNPGSYIELDKALKFKEYKWYNPSIKINYNLSDNDISDEFNRLFDNSIKLRLRSDVDVGIFLSGGLDSMSINNKLEKYHDKKIYKFIANVENKEEFENNSTDNSILDRFKNENNLDFKSININSKYYYDNIIKIISNYERILVNSSTILFYALSNLAKRNNVKVIMTGAGGDEIFGGYSWQKQPQYVPEFIFKFLLNKKNFKNYKFIKNYLEENTDKKISYGLIFRFLFQTKAWHNQSLSPYFQNILNNDVNSPEILINEISENYFEDIDFKVNDIHNIINLANINTTINAQNYDFDITTMQNSIENRAPFLDHNLFEFMLSIPSKIKYKKKSKEIQKKLFKNILPDYIINAPKSGPTLPINYWFNSLSENNKLSNFIYKNSYLISEFLSENLYFKIKEDRNFIFSNKSLPAFAILSFVIWAKINIEKSINDYDMNLSELL